MASPLADVIVVGVDGSEHSEWALDWAIEEAARTGRTLRLVHAWHWTADAMSIPAREHHGHGARHRGRELLDRCAAHAGRRVTTTTHLVEGSAADALIHAADGAAMLVVGSHGWGFLRRTLLGSVSEECVARASCPVVIIPGPERVAPSHRPTHATGPSRARPA